MLEYICRSKTHYFILERVEHKEILVELYRSCIGHPKPKGARFPLVQDEFMTGGLADDTQAGTSVYYATMKVTSLNHDFHGWILRIHEGWTRPWLGQVTGGCGRFGVSRECSQCILKARHEW